MKKLVIGFSKSKKCVPIASWLIRLYQWSSFSHTYIKLYMNSLPSDKMLHASEGLVQNMSETQFNKKHEIVKEYEIDIPDIIVTDKLTNSKKSLYHALMGIMHETAGANYSLMQNVGIAYVDFMRFFFNKRVKNPWSKGWNCSEFVMSILCILYPKEFKDLDLNTVTPVEIQRVLDYMDKDPNYPIRKINNGDKESK